MTPPQPQRCECGPCCAHVKVSSRKSVTNGLTTEWWECDSGCGARFRPVQQAAPTAEAPKISKRGEKLIEKMIQCTHYASAGYDPSGPEYDAAFAGLTDYVAALESEIAKLVEQRDLASQQYEILAGKFKDLREHLSIDSLALAGGIRITAYVIQHGTHRCEMTEDAKQAMDRILSLRGMA